MMLSLLILCAITAYFLGSIPTAVWYGKMFHGLDVREHGSGNSGATNAFRVLGKRAGTIVMLIDIAKGLVSTFIATILYKAGAFPVEKLIIMQLVFGVITVMGHIFSVFLNFKGGKGVATLMGMMIGIQFDVALMSAVIFLVCLLSTKYVSLSSILGAMSFPLMLLLVPRFQTAEPILIAFGFFLGVVVVWSHHKNIRRLIQGEENKTYLIKKKK